MVQRTSSVSELKLRSSFLKLRDRLLNQVEGSTLEKPLAFWAMPNDRRLPLAFMGRSIKELIETPFEELYATAGVGQKKISSMLLLLSRAANGKAPEAEEDPTTASPEAQMPSVDLENINPEDVSEETWANWRSAVVRTGYEHLTLGGVAPSLDRLPRVLWYTPLSAYTGLTLGEIRNLKTHGEKRVAALIEVFGAVYRIVRCLEPQPDLAVRIVPRIANELEEWTGGLRQRDNVPSADELSRRFIRPLLVQVRTDGGEELEYLARRRLGLTDEAPNVKEIATDMNLTRARVYQLLADIAEMMSVRWPRGVQTMGLLADELVQKVGRSSELEQFYTAVELFFPRRTDGVHRGNGHGLEGEGHPFGARFAESE